jgi:hypothetical protein
MSLFCFLVFFILFFERYQSDCCNRYFIHQHHSKATHVIDPPTTPSNSSPKSHQLFMMSPNVFTWPPISKSQTFIPKSHPSPYSQLSLLNHPSPNSQLLYLSLLAAYLPKQPISLEPSISLCHAPVSTSHPFP